MCARRIRARYFIIKFTVTLVVSFSPDASRTRSIVVVWLALCCFVLFCSSVLLSARVKPVMGTRVCTLELFVSASVLTVRTTSCCVVYALCMRFTCAGNRYHHRHHAFHIFTHAHSSDTFTFTIKSPHTRRRRRALHWRTPHRAQSWLRVHVLIQHLCIVVAWYRTAHANVYAYMNTCTPAFAP